MWPLGGANLDPRDMIYAILVGVYYTMLHAKYLSSRVYTSFEEVFLSFLYISLCKKCDPWGGANLDSRDIIYAISVGVHRAMLHAKYLSFRAYTLLHEEVDFYRFFFT